MQMLSEYCAVRWFVAVVSQISCAIFDPSMQQSQKDDRIKGFPGSSLNLLYHGDCGN